MENPLSKVLTSAPPPPAAEVKIRTMRSDIESMVRSGGGAPSFQSVAVSGLSLEREGHQASIVERTPMPAPSSYSVPAAPVIAATPPAPTQPVPTGESKALAAQASDFSPAPAPASTPAQEFVPEPVPDSHLMPILIVTLVAIIAVGVVGYFAYALFLK
jgi:hypothetical protein